MEILSNAEYREIILAIEGSQDGFNSAVTELERGMHKKAGGEFTLSSVFIDTGSTLIEQSLEPWTTYSMV